MIQPKKIFWYFLPRVLSVFLVIFISLFALDVFSQSNWLLALLIHFIPSAILIGLTILAWKQEKIGGTVFVLSGVLLIIFTRIEAYIIAIPLIIIGALYFLSNFLNHGRNHDKKVRAK